MALASRLAMPGICRDCFEPAADAVSRCNACGSPRVRHHLDLHSLHLGHIDCDAFYAAVEKRDNPALRDRPVIVGGGHRGVVSTACYIARLYGVRSAMPMFKALRACPEATVIRPNMKKYAAVGREVREMMLALTPLVEPLSLDEAFLDLAGTEKLHRMSPAESLLRLARRIEEQIGITVSIGLSYNKSLAKLASELDKPRGFALIGPAEAKQFLAARSVAAIWGVGKALQARLAADGITEIAQLQQSDEAELMARYGATGRRLARFAQGRDERAVQPNSPPKNISAETTFNHDRRLLVELEARLWPLCEKVASRMKRAQLGGKTVTLKLKTADFRLRSRSHSLVDHTQLAEVIYREGRLMLAREADGTPFRLIGIGMSGFVTAAAADPPDLLDPSAQRRAAVERTIDQVRARFGEQAIGKGRGLTVSSRDQAADRASPAHPSSRSRRNPEPGRR